MANFRLFVGHELDVGMKRTVNEDALGYHHPDNWAELERLGALFVVADGVGGLSDGVVASDMAVRRLIEGYFSGNAPGDVRTYLQNLLKTVNSEVFQKYNSKSATTIVVGLLRQNELITAHVGDSRAYLYQNNKLTQLTQDHVHPVQQADGRTKYKLLHAIGYKNDVEVELQKFPLLPNSRLILMSDGAIRYLNDTTLTLLIRSHDTPQELAKALIEYSNTSGGVDNISVIVVDVEDTLQNEEDLQAHLKILDNKPQAQPQFTDAIASESDAPVNAVPDEIPDVQSEKKRSPIVTLVFMLIIIGALAGGAFFLLNSPQDNAETVSDTSTLTQPETQNDAPAVGSDTEDVDETDTNTAAPSATTAVTTPQTLEEGAVVAFDDSGSTRVRIEDDTVAFVIKIDESYLIADQYQSRDGIWYRLYDERNETYGWIEESDLPPYRFIP